jgi:hypothetical protein
MFCWLCWLDCGEINPLLMPVYFGVCNVPFDKEEFTNEAIEFVNSLNEKFSKRSCVCHPDKLWHYAVDLIDKNVYYFHDGPMSDYTCEFGKKILIEAEQFAKV